MSSIVPYCERLAGGAELWNVFSNLAFVLLGLYAFRRLAPRRAGPRPGTGRHEREPGVARAGAAATERMLGALALLPFAIAAGSALYHLRPSRATQLADVVPIGLFVALALWLALREVLALERAASLAALLAWLVSTLVGAGLVRHLYGSLLYVPTLLALVLVALAAATRAPRERRALAAAAALFAVALAARTLDLPLCERLAPGTHPLWHLFAALAGAAVLDPLARAAEGARRPLGTVRD